MSPVAMLKAIPAELFEEPGPVASWRRSALAELSDGDLVRAVAALVSVPKAGPGDSFTLHAPLELLARASLLPLVPVQARDAARWRIAGIASRYAALGPDLDPVQNEVRDESHAQDALLAAMQQGNADGADAAYQSLVKSQSLSAIRALLAPRMLPSLAAAAHAPILFAHLPEWDERIGGLAGLARHAIRALAAFPALKLNWMFREEPFQAQESRDLLSVLIAPPRLNSPNHFIAPMLLAAEQAGAATLLSEPLLRTEPRQIKRTLMRVAALSMLYDDPAQAPYGWSHALTIPMGILNHASQVPANYPLHAIAATHTLALRGVMSRAGLPRAWAPEAFSTAEPDATAAALAAYAAERPYETVVPKLVARAAAHEDGHLVKYTQACLTAAAQDPEARALYLAAAAYLGAWWDAHPDAGFES